ncbi:MAG TPA: hypothetical protein PLR99_05080 [Polyangiaceae bacterium]|nr:hypothetical protein [Polyangiaceae bacterium]
MDVPGNQGKVVAPPGAVTKKSTLAVSAITGLAAPPEADLGGTLDVRLGDLTRFDEPVTIEIPYDPAKVLGRRGKRPSLLALTYDPAKRTWDPVPFSVDEQRRIVVVDTTHLSFFSTVFPKPIQIGPAARVEYATYPFAVDFADASTAQNILSGSFEAAAEEGWEASMEWFGIGQAVATLGEGGAAFASYAGAASVLGRVNDLAGNLGIAFAVVQLALDMSKEGNKRVAVGNAMRAIGLDAISRWGTSAMKVAGVGVFFLDYSLNEFASTAWAGRKDLWARAFACYYANNGRTHAQWLARFKAIVSEARTPDAASAGIRDEVVAYSKNIWSADGADLGMCQAELGAAFLGSFGGLSEATKKDLSAEYARQLFADLTPELSALAKWATAQQQERTHRLLEELRGRWNQETTVEIALKTKDPKRKLDGVPVAITTKKDPARWRGTTDAKGVFTMQITALGYMLYGRPTEVVATLPGPDGKPELRRGTLVYKPGKTRVEVDLDGVAGSFEGELSGTYTGPGLDGPVPMKGPIRIVVDDAGVAKVTFEVKTGFTAGRGMTTMASTTTGTATGRLEGTTLAAKGSVATQMKVVVRLPGGREQRRDIPSSSPVSVDATLIGSDRFEGKVSGNPGAKTLPFTATRR